MNIRALIDRSNSGDIDSMIEVGDYFIDNAQSLQDELNAVEWYEKASQYGSSLGSAKAAMEYIAMAKVLRNANEKELSFDFWKKAIFYGFEMTKRHDEYFDLGIKMLNDAFYGTATIWYLDGQYQNAIDRINMGNKTPRDNILKALCMISVGSPMEEILAAIPLYDILSGQEGYVNRNEIGKADTFEQVAYATVIKLLRECYDVRNSQLTNNILSVAKNALANENALKLIG